MKKEVVVVGMSGGVDSSVAAYLLQKEGYFVIGATMKLLDDENTFSSIEDAKKVCSKLGISHYVFDLSKEFKQLIIQYFIDSYKDGRTPNPCVMCNKYFKFDLFYQKARELNADYIATGHYARIRNGRLMFGNAKEKDQSYFLCQVNKNIFPYVLFPLSDYDDKEKIRSIAREAGLPVSDKKDSQEICFIPKDDYKSFLQKHFDNQVPGNIMLGEGTVLGKHSGLYKYTVGQRKGLNISYKEPLYVLRLDVAHNAVVVGTNQELFQNKLFASHMNYLVDKKEFFSTKLLYAKIRSKSSLEKVSEVVDVGDNHISVAFDISLRAISPGQFIVFYNEQQECLGGGYIER